MAFVKSMLSSKKSLQKVAKEYRVPLAFVYGDCLACRVFHGSFVSDYVNFSMYSMNGWERRQYVTAARSTRLEKLFNTGDEREREIIGDKRLFNLHFAKYVRRGWLYAPEHTDEEIKAFVLDRKELMIKPLRQSKGQGVRKETTESIRRDGLDAFVSRAKQEQLLLEDVICQHPALSAVNPSSVNTVRIATARDRAGDVHIVGASLRAGGKDSVLDNLHAGGVQYPIDVESGCIMRGGVKFDGTKNVLYHPSTGCKMIGLQIPNWDIVVDTVKEAGGIPSDLRYIGWDVAVTEDGCELIEANLVQGRNGMQQDGVGKYRIILQYA